MDSKKGEIMNLVVVPKLSGGTVYMSGVIRKNKTISLIFACLLFCKFVCKKNLLAQKIQFFF